MGWIMVDEGRANLAAGATIGAHGQVKLAAKDKLFKFWLSANVDQLVNVGNVRGLTIGAGNLGLHEFSPETGRAACRQMRFDQARPF